MKKEAFYISAAIDYPSGQPHIGHALEKIQADVLARHKRTSGARVHFSLGTDEHGLKIQRRAEKERIKPQEFVDRMSRHFRKSWDDLNIQYDDFIRTSEKRHIDVVQEIIQQIYKSGDIYKGHYKGLYCVDCESFYLPRDLIDNKCPIHKKLLEKIEEETYFFKLKKYKDDLLNYFKNNPDFVIPQSRSKEIVNRLKDLEDLSISRKSVGWGVPLPFDTDFTLFVWVDALINYLSTLGYPGNNFKKFWPADIHAIGKDILWHHTVIWGALLLSLELDLPKRIFVHGYITAEGQKMSKSLGNVVNPNKLVKKYGTDPVRYFFLREISPFEDGDFSYEKFEERYNADLAKGLGNLVARVVTLATKPKTQNPKAKTTIQNSKLEEEIDKTKKNYKRALEEFKFNEALQAIWGLIGFCDKYIEQERPWEDIENKGEVINDLLLAIEAVAKFLEPFLPETTEKIF